jgi:hypothetical protein
LEECPGGGDVIYANFINAGAPNNDVVYINFDGGSGCYIVQGLTGEPADVYVLSKTDQTDCNTCNVSPTPTPTQTRTPAATPTVTPTKTPTSTPTRTPTGTPTTTPTPTKTKTPTPTQSNCSTQIQINWAIQTCARGTFEILVNGGSVYTKNALGIAGSGTDTISVPYNSTITLNGSAINVAGGSCVGIYDTSAINMTPTSGGANGVTIVRVSDGTPNTFSYSYTKTCPNTVITLDYVPNPI